MPLSDDEPINITFVKTVGKYRCLYDSIPLYNENTLSDRIYFLTSIFRVLEQVCLTSYPKLPLWTAFSDFDGAFTSEHIISLVNIKILKSYKIYKKNVTYRGMAYIEYFWNVVKDSAKHLITRLRSPSR